MSNEITPEALAAGPFQNDGHTDFGGLRVSIMRHTTIRRLIALDRPLDLGNRETAENTVRREWLVDGQPVSDLVEAARRVTIPPQLTEEEILILEKIPEDWVELTDLKKIITKSLRPKVSPILVKLHLKGLIENQLNIILQRSVPSVRRTPSKPIV